MTTAIDYGSDVDCVADIDPLFTIVSGPIVVAQTVARRLTTPPNTLPEEPDTFDVMALLGESFTPASLFAAETSIASQAEKDERVLRADVTIAFNQSTKTIAIAITLNLASGPFAFVLDVTAAAVLLTLPQTN